MTGGSGGGAGGGGHPKPSLTGDWHNMFLLLALYTLQGVPLGFASSVPMYMESRGASFAEQATFSLATWPYSLKLLWAPIVDSLFTTRWRLGLRKTWIIPTQMVTGVVLIALSAHLNEAFGGRPEDTSSHAAAGSINVAALTAAFFGLYFLAATQDIAVDGWALTLLRPENLGYASAANTIGQVGWLANTWGGRAGLAVAQRGRTVPPPHHHDLHLARAPARPALHCSRSASCWRTARC